MKASKKRFSVLIPGHGTYVFHPAVFADVWTEQDLKSLGALQNLVMERATGIVPRPDYSNRYGKAPEWVEALAQYNTLSRFECVAMLADWETASEENAGFDRWKEMGNVATGELKYPLH